MENFEIETMKKPESPKMHYGAIVAIITTVSLAMLLIGWLINNQIQAWKMLENDLTTSKYMIQQTMSESDVLLMKIMNDEEQDRGVVNLVTRYSEPLTYGSQKECNTLEDLEKIVNQYKALGQTLESEYGHNLIYNKYPEERTSQEKDIYDVIRNIQDMYLAKSTLDSCKKVIRFHNFIGNRYFDQ